MGHFLERCFVFPVPCRDTFVIHAADSRLRSFVPKKTVYTRLSHASALLSTGLTRYQHIWLRRLDSNQRMSESKSDVLTNFTTPQYGPEKRLPRQRATVFALRSRASLLPANAFCRAGKVRQFRFPSGCPSLAVNPPCSYDRIRYLSAWRPVGDTALVMPRGVEPAITRMKTLCTDRYTMAPYLPVKRGWSEG